MPDWNYQPLGVVAPAVQAPFPAATEEVWNLSLEEIESGTGRVLQKVTSRVSELGSSKCSFTGDHVLYSKLRPYLNKVVVPDGPGVGTSELIPLRPRKNALDREFLAWYLRSPAFLEFSQQNTRGANLPRIAMDALWAHGVPTPPLEEQRRIVGRIRDAISVVDEVTGLRADVAAMHEALLPATLEDLFRGVEAPEEPLSVLLAGEPQNGLYLPREEYSDADGSVPMVHMGDMFRRFELAHTFPRRVIANEGVRAKYGLRPGDVLVARRSLVFEGSGSMTEVPDLREPTLFESSIIRIRPAPTLAPGYLVAYFFSRTGTERRLAITRKATISGVNQGGLLSLRVPVPPIEVQCRVVAAVKEVRLAVEALRMEVPSPEVAGLRSAILCKAFAGEL